MKAIILSMVLFLSACSTIQPVPVNQKFPVAPDILMEQCPPLLSVDNDKYTLSEMLKVVIQNYATYYQCANKTSGWQEWYKSQQKVFEELTK